MLLVQEIMEIGDIVVHKTEGLVKLVSKQLIETGSSKISYLVFEPYFLQNKGNKIMLPDGKTDGLIRDTITAQKARYILQSVVTLKSENWENNNKERGLLFDEILRNGDPEKLSLMIYLVKRKENELKGTKKAISKHDGDCLRRAQTILFSELAYLLNMSNEELNNAYQECL